MKVKTKLLVKKFIKYDLWHYALILACICLTAYILNKWIEAICFCAAHLILRPKFDKQYHNYVTQICLLITTNILFFGINSTLPVSVSLLSSIPVALFICWVGYIAADRLDLIIANKTLNKPKIFNLDTCTEIELKERCQIVFKRDVEYKTERAIKHFILKLPHEEIDINVRTSQTERQRMKKLLTK